MTPSELKHKVETNTNSKFFTRSTMKFFGDTMKNYGVRTNKIKTYVRHESGIITGYGDVDVWELYRKNPVKCGLTGTSYFDKTTFKKVNVA